MSTELQSLANVSCCKPRGPETVSASSSENEIAGARKYKYEVIWGIFFSELSSQEVENVMGMQVMFGTMATLIAGIAVDLFAAQSIDAAKGAEERLRSEGCNGLAGFISFGSAWCSVASLTAAMFTVFLSLFLYVALAAANFPEGECDEAVKTWTRWNYPLLCIETLCIIVATTFIWGAAYCVGVIKYDVSCAKFGSFGITGLCLLLALVVFILFAHWKSTLPALKKAHDPDYKRRAVSNRRTQPENSSIAAPSRAH